MIKVAEKRKKERDATEFSIRGVGTSRLFASFTPLRGCECTSCACEASVDPPRSDGELTFLYYAWSFQMVRGHCIKRGEAISGFKLSFVKTPNDCYNLSEHESTKVIRKVVTSDCKSTCMSITISKSNSKQVSTSK